MIELKVQCDCGQRYKFDVGPVNGRMPFTVNCPICGADGTEKANALLAQMATQSPIRLVSLPSTPVAAPVETSVAAAVAPAEPVTVAASAPAAPSRLRINVSAHAPSSAPPPLAPGAVAPAAPRPFPDMARPTTADVMEASKKKPSFWMGMLGGFLGVLLGAAIYFVVFKYSGYQIGLIGIAVGFLGGLGAHLMGRGEGSKELGGIVAILALIGIVSAQYFVAMGWWHEAVRDVEDAGYSASIVEAKEVVKAVPTGSDAEIKAYLVKQATDDGEDATSVTDNDIKQFREKLPEYQDLAGGKETKEQYFAKNGIDSKEMKKAEDEGESTFKGIFLLLLLGRVNIFSMIAAAGIAYKMSSNA